MGTTHADRWTDGQVAGQQEVGTTHADRRTNGQGAGGTYRVVCRAEDGIFKGLEAFKKGRRGGVRGNVIRATVERRLVGVQTHMVHQDTGTLQHK